MKKQSLTNPEPNLESSALNMIKIFRHGSAASKKTIPIKFLIKIALIISSLFSLQTLQADEIKKEAASPTWYEIELLIFSRINPDPEHNEYWNQYLKLSFPSKLGVLDTYIDPEKFVYIEDVEKEAKFNTEETQTETIYPSFTGLGIRGTRLSYAERRLKKSGQFKILSHQRWVQPLNDKKNSLPLLLQAGDIYNGIYELEGTVQVSVSRYIHIESNLWLTTFSENQTLLDPWWLETDNEQTLTPALNQSQFAKSNHCSKDFSSGLQNPVEANDKELNNEKGMGYIITQIAQMKQSRRMRSKEIHYLDHPLFGLIVIARPYTPVRPDIDASTPISNNLKDVM